MVRKGPSAPGAFRAELGLDGSNRGVQVAISAMDKVGRRSEKTSWRDIHIIHIIQRETEQCIQGTGRSFGVYKAFLGDSISLAG